MLKGVLSVPHKHTTTYTDTHSIFSPSTDYTYIGYYPVSFRVPYKKLLWALKETGKFETRATYCSRAYSEPASEVAEPYGFRSSKVG